MLLQNVFLLASLWAAALAEEQNYYEILGLEKDADNRAIRRAYKKLAMHFHPDKNKEDGAHEKFVRINRAYEVLKDEELRKKYDQFGEAGLAEGFQPNPGPSWQFFQTFGIYDEDSDIATLTRQDFASSVLEGGVPWFVNFYSTHCGHCHQLAPAWRRVAVELAGVLRIGAVNCAEDPLLCQQQGINGYPALMLFPERRLYPGQREQEAMVAFALANLPSTIHRLTAKNFHALTSEWEPYKDRAWVLQLASDPQHAPLSKKTLRKAALMLEGLANVGGADCATEEDLCESLGLDGTAEDEDVKVAFFPAHSVTKASKTLLASTDAQELGAEVYKLLPDIRSITPEELESRVGPSGLGAGEGEGPLLVHFVHRAEDADVAFRKLPSLIPEVPVRRLNCSLAASLCGRLNVAKPPQWAVLKASGGLEVHHGAQGVHELAAFANAAAKAPLRIVLGPEDFEALTGDGERPWLIDFFAPWCPPCMQLLPEVRKASAMAGGRIGFATVDCTLHQELCTRAAVQSYPTSVLFNGSAPPSPFVGVHPAQEILDFIADLQDPPVKVLTPETFASLVEGRPEGRTWIVDFFAPWCGPCQQLAPEFRKLAKLIQTDEVRLGSVDCAEFSSFCMAQKVQGYPSVRLYHREPGQPLQHFAHFQRDALSMRVWAMGFLPSLVETLDGDGFAAVLSSQEVWLVDFYAPWCGPCQIFAPEFEAVGKALESRGVKVGKVDCDSVHVCQGAGIRAYPSVRLYTGAASPFESQEPQGALHIGSQSAQQIIEIMTQHLDTLHAQRKARDEL